MSAAGVIGSVLGGLATIGLVVVGWYTWRRSGTRLEVTLYEGRDDSTWIEVVNTGRQASVIRQIEVRNAWSPSRQRIGPLAGRKDVQIATASMLADLRNVFLRRPRPRLGHPRWGPDYCLSIPVTKLAGGSELPISLAPDQAVATAPIARDRVAKLRNAQRPLEVWAYALAGNTYFRSRRYLPERHWYTQRPTTG